MPRTRVGLLSKLWLAVSVGLLLVTLVCILSLSAFLWWSSDRGFDITDDGFYLLASQFPRDVLVWPNAAYWFTALLFRVVAQNVVAFRRLGLVISLGCGALMYYGVHRALASEPTNSDARDWHELLTEGTVVASGALLAYCWSPLTPSYIVVNSWALAAGCGAFFVGMASAGPALRRSRWWLVAAGASVTVTFFSKFATGFLLAGLYGVALALWPMPRAGGRRQASAALAAGAILAFVCFFLFAQSPAAWWRAFSPGLAQYSSILGESTVDVLRRHYHQWTQDVVMIVAVQRWRVWTALAAVGVIIQFVGTRRWIVNGVLELMMAGLLGYAAYESVRYLLDFDSRFMFFDIVRFHFGWLVIFAITAGTWRARTFWRRESVSPPALRVRLIVAPMLFVLPFAAAVGTGNYLYVNMTNTMAPWLALSVLMLRIAPAPGHRHWVGQVALAGLAAACAFEVIAGLSAAPYRLNSPLRAQTHSTPIGVPPTMLKLDVPGHQFFTTLQAMAQKAGFTPGDDLLGFSDLPGVVFALGGRSPGIPWYTWGYPGSIAVNSLRLAAVGPQRVSRAFLLETDNSCEWLKTLGRFGLDFPNGYALVGELQIPYPWTKDKVRLWRPLLRHPE